MRTKTKEGLQFIALLAAASLVAALPLSWQAASPETEQEDRAGRGGQSYRIYCASCHGTGGEGDGPMARALHEPPADLTRISERYGSFPEERIAAVIDGRFEVLSHGPGSMPVWGLSFQDAGRDMDQEREVQERIRDLVAYLESIQRQPP
jgi:mono/diheme cytochrome c family protein